MANRPSTLELLAPARDLATGIAAIDHGADAVYIGPAHHGARAAAGNSIDELRTLAEYAHRYRARVYATVNTLVYADELESVRDLVAELYRAGIDALIVQDMALAEMDIPPIALHASTQCDTRTVDRAIFLANAGFDQIVLPREFTVDEIRAVRDAVPDVTLEGFVHGAVCVCYSGDCRASYVSGGRSANRGECAQICRLPYDLTDGDGNVLIHDRHLLSLRDMNRLAHLSVMADAGIRSFKIEGRLKSVDYVSNVTAAYSKALDLLVESSAGRYTRASAGRVETSFTPDVDKSFNRGYTTYFLTDAKPGTATLGAHATPKWVGQPIGTVVDAKPRCLSVKVSQGTVLNNGDGIGYFDREGKLIGFRINRVDGSRLMLNASLPAPLPTPGTELYRNFDKAFADRLASDRTVRVIDLDMTLDRTLTGISLTLTDTRGCTVTSAISTAPDEARTPQSEARRRTLERLGDTIYRLRSLTDNLGNAFIPASVLTDLRRRAIDALDHAAAATRPVDLRRPAPGVTTSAPFKATNVANPLAERFYTKRGVTDIEQAIEVLPEGNSRGETRVMTTRYCLRRELGACLLTPDGKKLPRTLILRPLTGNVRPMRLDFDCAACRMNVIALPR